MSIDEKIDALIQWHKNYPDIKIERMKKDKPISQITIEKLKELSQREGNEFSEIEEIYKKMQSYNEYVMHRDFEGKLTPEQIMRCKEGNLGGRFGFPTKIEEEAKKYNVRPEQVIDINNRFGSIDSFIEMYRSGSLCKDDVILCNTLFINNLIDIDCSQNSKNYSDFICVLFKYRRFREENIIHFYSSNAIDEKLNTLDLIERDIIRKRYGLDNGMGMSLAECGDYYHLSVERCRQIEAKAIRILSTIPKRKINFITLNDLTDELSYLEDDVWNSNLIFKQKAELDGIDFDTMKLLDIRKKLEDLRKKAELSEQFIAENKYRYKEEAELRAQFIAKRMNTDMKKTIEEMEEQFRIRELKANMRAAHITGEDVEISDINFSNNTSFCLKRAGFRTLEDLLNTSYEDLNKIKSLGETGIVEIISRLIVWGLDFKRKDNDKDEVIICCEHSKYLTIDAANFSVKTYNCLKKAGITTLGDLTNMRSKDLKNIRNLGQKSIDEIVSKLAEYGLSLNDEPISNLINSYEITDEQLDEQPEQIFIDAANFSVKTYNCLKRAGIETLGDLTNTTYEELIKIRRMGQRGIDEIISKLAEYGLTLKNEVELQTSESGNQETTRQIHTESCYTKSEIEELRAQKTELEAQLGALKEETRKVRQLLNEYKKLNGDDKVYTDE